MDSEIAELVLYRFGDDGVVGRSERVIINYGLSECLRRNDGVLLNGGEGNLNK